MTDGSWSPGLRARQGRDRARFSQSCLCLPGSEVTQAWLRQEAGLLPSHWESRPTMLLCNTFGCIWGPKIHFGVIVFLPDNPVPEKGLPAWSLSEVVFVLVA